MNDIHRYKRLFITKLSKRGDSSFLARLTKGVAIFIFAAGLTATANIQDPSNITPLYEYSQNEIVVNKDTQQPKLASGQLFLSAKLINSVNASTPENQGDSAIGGGDQSLYPTAEGSTLLAINYPVIPEIPEKQEERSEITEYVVKSGDTPSQIASSFGLKLETLLWANHLTNPDLIKPGQNLIILPIDGVHYEIKNGDTLAAIAKTHKAEIADILEANGIESAQHIFAGQNLIIPGGIKPSTTSSYSSTTKYASSRQNLDYNFIRPTTGRITQYLHGYNAVDIGNSCWTPIYAAASGTVGIAIANGAWNGGYGNYVTISHYNGTRTLYAHMIKVSTWTGQSVGQGQLIGYMGSTGRSTGCHLHWEVHGARNPMAY